jgi:heat shock protein HslJ
MRSIDSWLVVVAAAAFQACGGATSQADGRGSGPATTIVGVTWEWVSTVNPVERIEVADPSRYTLTLLAGGEVRAGFDCNRGGGSYELSTGRLSFGPFMSTRMACPEDSQADLFMRDLQRVTSFFEQDGELYLELPYDSGTMRFRPSAVPRQ